MTWYEKGLQFKCTGCGACCTGEPGYVWLSEDEIDQMANHLQISRQQFIQTYTRSVFGRPSLKENRVTYDCVFLKDRKCSVYEVRPLQCRTFPWWEENLSSPEAWKQTGVRCEGIDHPEGPIIPLDTIEIEKNR